MVITPRPLLERVRLFLWRHRRGFAVLYLGVLVLLSVAVWQYRVHAPAMLDLGGTVALRSLAYQRTFAEVERAREEAAEGRRDAAVARLERFLEEHRSVQAGQLYTHAVTDAHELLAELYLSEERRARAVETLAVAVERSPLDYRLWLLKGRAHRVKGELPEAAECFRAAFELTLDLPEVVQDYLGVLDELRRHEEIVWVADQMKRAAVRVAPLVEVKAGPLRSALVGQVLDFVGIPVEHGEYRRSLRRTGLPRGTRRELSLPRELFRGLPADPEPLSLQLCFENVYEGLQIEALRWTLADGRKGEMRLPPDAVHTLHRPHSGAEYYAEVRVPLPTDRIEEFTVVYTCPPHELEERFHQIIEAARRNVAAQETL